MIDPEATELKIDRLYDITYNIHYSQTPRFKERFEKRKFLEVNVEWVLKSFYLEIKAKHEPRISFLVLKWFLLNLQNDLKKDYYTTLFLTTFISHRARSCVSRLQYQIRRQVLFILKCCHGTHHRRAASKPLWCLSSWE